MGRVYVVVEPSPPDAEEPYRILHGPYVAEASAMIALYRARDDGVQGARVATIHPYMFAMDDLRCRMESLLADVGEP